MGERERPCVRDRDTTGLDGGGERERARDRDGGLGRDMEKGEEG